MVLSSYYTSRLPNDLRLYATPHFDSFSFLLLDLVCFISFRLRPFLFLAR